LRDKWIHKCQCSLVSFCTRLMLRGSLINLLILFIMAIACGVGDSVLEHQYQPRSAPWLYGDDSSSDNPSINGLVTWAFAFLTSVSLFEMSRVGVTYFIADSKQLFPSRCTYQWRLCAHSRRHSYILTKICGMLKVTKQRLRRVGTSRTIWVSNSKQLLFDPVCQQA
jgi:hypothetical protein